MLKVRDVMSSNFTSVKPSTPIIEVAQRMRESGNGVVLVSDNGRFRGLITEKDIVIGIVAKAFNPKREHVRSLMGNLHPIVSPDEEIARAAEIMVNRGVRILPVVQNGNLVGLLTMDDISRENSALAAMVLSQTCQVCS